MARKRDDGVLRFDLSDAPDDASSDRDDEVRAPGAGAPGEVLAPARPRPGVGGARDWVAGHRRTLVPVVAGLAALALAGAATGTVQERRRVERLLTAPGGVLSLDTPPEELWRATVSGVPAGMLDGDLLVVGPEGALGLDPETGGRRWSAPLESAQCAGQLGWPGASGGPVDQVVCLVGPEAGRAAVVVGPGGSVSQGRALDPAFAGAVPGRDGTVVLVRRTGEAADLGDATARCSEDQGCATAGSLARVRDVEVRVEDALTGEVRWTDTVPGGTDVDPGMCVRWEGDEDPSLDVDEVTVQHTAGLVTLWGCGVDQGWTADGVPLGETRSDGRGRVFLEVPGGFVEDRYDEGVSRFFGADGHLQHEIQGQAMVPMADDGTADGTRFVQRPGGPLRAYDEDGGLVWEAERGVGTLLAVADGVVLGTAAGPGLLAFDRLTGEVLWEWSAPSHGTTDDGLEISGSYVEAAFTDGRSVLTLVRRIPMEGGVREPPPDAYAVDLTSGRTRWSAPLPGSVTSLGGRLVSLDVPREADPLDASLGLVALG